MLRLNGIAAQTDFFVLQDVTQHKVLAGLTDLVPLIFLAVFGGDRDGDVVFFDFFLRIENRANDEVRRLRGAESAEVWANVAALIIDRVAGGAS